MSALVWCSSAGRGVVGIELRDLLRGGGASPPSSDSPLEARLMRVSPRFSHDYYPEDVLRGWGLELELKYARSHGRRQENL